MASDDGVDPALVARDVIGVGVTGHRLERLQQSQIAGVIEALDGALAAIEVAVGHGSRPIEVRLITSLADGVDALASEVALARQWPVDTILPFPRAEYARDFLDGDGLSDHQRLLAASRAVFELPGERKADGDGAAYERAGRVTLAQSDILLAVWDGRPPRGRGGTGQIVAEAVLQGLPVILIDPADLGAPQLLWDGLIEHDLGQQSIDTVARGDMKALPQLLAALVERPDSVPDRKALAAFAQPGRQKGGFAFAYPLLETVVGVRKFRMRDWSRPDPVQSAAPVVASIAPAQQRGRDFAQHLDGLCARFVRADTEALTNARLFRSSYVSNFMLAALAVILSLFSLLLPMAFKPLLLALEFITIASILLITRAGTRLDWHRRWLDHRELAERLRCLALSAQLGDLDLRAGQGSADSWLLWFARATARETGLPNLAADSAYLEELRSSLRNLLDDQIAYLTSSAHRTHQLEHRLHQIGTALFAATAAVCVGVLMLVWFGRLGLFGLRELPYTVSKVAIVISAALPAIGSAIYGIRMQGDFGGASARDAALAAQLTTLRHVVDQDALSFDTLKLRTARATDLLTAELADWGQSYRARPLTLPG